jgi:hypothetical protein
MRYQWGQDNKWRRLPENYTFNCKMTPLVAWQLWHHGDSDAPPLKFIDQLDPKGKMRPKRTTEVCMLNDSKFICNESDNAVGVRRGTTPTIIDLIAHYNSEAISMFLPSATTSKSRERHTQELN